jgi:hypothetical protein
MGFFDLLFGSPSGSTQKVLSGVTSANIKRDWENIDILLKQKGPSQLRQALITADKTLDNALRDLVAGESMGERLKNAEKMFEWGQYQKLWEAHKLRNNLVHESGYEPPYFMVTEAVNHIRSGLIAIGVSVK